MNVRQAVLWIVILNVTLLLHGCEKNTYELQMTAGMPAPFVEIRLDDVEVIPEGQWHVHLPGELKRFNPVWLVFNIGVLVCGLLLLRKFAPRVSKALGAPRSIAALGISGLLMHSFFIWGAVWVWTVFFPTGWIAGVMQPVISIPEVRLDIASRIWFVLIIGIVWAISFLPQLIWQWIPAAAGQRGTRDIDSTDSASIRQL